MANNHDGKTIGVDEFDQSRRQTSPKLIAQLANGREIQLLDLRDRGTKKEVGQNQVRRKVVGLSLGIRNAPFPAVYFLSAAK